MNGKQLAAMNREVLAARVSECAGDLKEARLCLELAQVLGQEFFVPHFRVHLAMLGFAFRQGDWREVRAQVLRLALTPLGHIAGRLPQFNTGSGRVSAFAPMDWPRELDRSTLERTDRT